MSNANLYKRIVKVARITSAASTNAQVITTGRCVVLSVSMTVATAGTLRTTHLFNMGTVPNPATDSALSLLDVFCAPNNSVHWTFSDGLVFSNGLALTITNGVAPASTTATNAAEIFLTITYAEV